MEPLKEKRTEHSCTHQRLMTLISQNSLTRKCSVFAKKAWHMITEYIAIPNQIMLICFFTLHADKFGGFIMQSLLGHTFFWLKDFCTNCPYKGGININIPKLINREKRFFYISQNPGFPYLKMTSEISVKCH